MRSSVRAAAVLVAGLTTAGLLAGCGDDAGDPPDFSESEEPVLWNPCDALDPDWIEQEFGIAATEKTGTSSEPECRFRPNQDGDPVITAEYQLFIGSLEAAWETMKLPEDADVRSPELSVADDARLVVNRTKKQFSITGYVENGDLIQIVNLVDPAPYDAQRDERGVRRMLEVLAEHATDQGVPESE